MLVSKYLPSLVDEIDKMLKDYPKKPRGPVTKTSQINSMLTSFFKLLNTYIEQ